MKKILIILALLTNLGCVYNRKAPLPIIDKKSSVYNDILNELVTDHFYNLYLGAHYEKLGETFDYNRDDSTYLKEVEKLRKLVHSDTSRQSAICLGHALSFVKFSQLSIENFNDSTDSPADLRDIFKQVSSNYKAVYDSLTTVQQLSADLFHPSSYKVKGGQCGIGSVSFSKVFINTQNNKGLLYYEFYCGEKCGKGEILLIENKAGVWTIRKNLRLWIS